MTTGTVSLDRRGHVLVIGLDRAAKRNAFDLPLWDALCRAYGELDRDPDLRVGVLHAHGDHFTGGLDLPQWAPVFASGQWHIPAGGVDPLGLTGPRLHKPIVAAVQGVCLTIGIELLLATDLRVAASSTRFGQIEIKRGIYPVGGATLRFPRECGWANAMRWLLTGETLRGVGGVTYLASSAKAARELGFAPRPLDEGLRHLVEHEMRVLGLPPRA